MHVLLISEAASEILAQCKDPPSPSAHEDPSRLFTKFMDDSQKYFFFFCLSLFRTIGTNKKMISGEVDGTNNNKNKNTNNTTKAVPNVHRKQI